MLNKNYKEILDNLDENTDIYIKFYEDYTKAFLAELEIKSIYYFGPNEYSQLSVRFNNKIYIIDRVYINSDLTPGTRIYAPIIIYSSSLGVPIGFSTEPIKGAQSICNNIDDFSFIRFDESKSIIIESYERLILVKPKTISQSFQARTYVSDLLPNKKYNDYDLDIILKDLGIATNLQEVTPFETTGNSYETDNKNQKRLLLTNEPKIYYTPVQMFKLYKSKFIVTRDSLQKSMINKKNIDFRLTEYNLLCDFIKENHDFNKFYTLSRLKLRPWEIKFERKPKGNRKTIDGFVFIDSKNHQLISDILVYEDGQSSAIKASSIIENRKAIIIENAKARYKTRKNNYEYKRINQII